MMNNMKEVLSFLLIMITLFILSSCNIEDKINKENSSKKDYSKNTNVSENIKTKKQSFDDVLNEYIQSEDNYWRDIEYTPESDFDYHLVNKSKNKKIFDNFCGINERAKKELNSIDTYVSIEGYKGNSDIIKIPEKIKGYKVKSVSLNSPYKVDGELVNSYANLTSLYIPDSVVYLNLNGYFNSLQQFRLPNKECDYSDNSRMNSLMTIYYKKNSQQIHITKRDSLQKMYIDKGIKDVIVHGDSLAECSPNLKKIYIPSSVNIIGEETLDFVGNSTKMVKKEENIFKGLIGVTIVTQKDSYAEEYAQKYNIKYEILE